MNKNISNKQINANKLNAKKGGSMLKGRIKRLERNIAKILGKSRTKIWLINVSSSKSKKETTPKKKIQDIKSGKVPYDDGSYFSDEDENIFVISAVPRPHSKRQN